jgi:hypothetical protein
MLSNKSEAIRELLKAYKESWGNVSYSCEIANINPATFYRWKQKDKKFKERLEEANRYLVDRARSRLGEKIDKGETQAIIFFLKTKAREEFGDKLNINLEMQRYQDLMARVFDKTPE